MPGCFVESGLVVERRGHGEISVSNPAQCPGVLARQSVLVREQVAGGQSNTWWDGKALRGDATQGLPAPAPRPSSLSS